MKIKPPTRQISTNFELLLQAALLSGEVAQNAYRHWKKAVDLESLNDDFSYYLLPKLYLNQQNNNSDADKTLKKLKGIYRRTWLENQFRIPPLQAIFKLFAENRIDFIVLSQTPLVWNLLADTGVFSLDNFDVLIDSAQIQEADTILQKNGWLTTQNPIADENIFYRNENSTQIILRQSFYTKSVWKNAVEIDFGGTKIKSLSLNQQILSLCKADFGNDKNELWVFYFYLIFSLIPIDWKSLRVEANQHQCCTRLFLKLNYLNELFVINIPPDKLKILQKEAEKEITPPGKLRTAMAAYRSLQTSYRQSLSDNSTAPEFWGFIKFLREHWQTNSVLFVPWQIGKRLVKSNSKLRD
jgi:predicted nucleotidyltransferase